MNYQQCSDGLMTACVLALCLVSLHPVSVYRNEAYDDRNMGSAFRCVAACQVFIQGMFGNVSVLVVTVPVI